MRPELLDLPVERTQIAEHDLGVRAILVNGERESLAIHERGGRY